MKELLDIITEELKAAFEQAGFPSGGVKAAISNRPDLCEFQCNGALMLAKQAKQPPVKIAEQVAEILRKSASFDEVSAAAPGFINLRLSGEYVAEFVSDMAKEERFGFVPEKSPGKIVIDYGGPNIAKPLHIGHLRSAIIGESVKRICRYAGGEVIGDVHLGDWGLQMGQIIAELRIRKPSLPYFDEGFDGEYPQEAPFTLTELEEIYPCASAKCKTDEAFYEEAKTATSELQQGRRGYTAIWRHVRDISVADLKKNYGKLNVSFDLWNGESDAQKYIPDMIEGFKEGGFLEESDGALVIDVSEESDKKEIPPCIVVKSGGGALYATTDLATIVSRVKDYSPSHIIYVVDKRQELHFTQVFRAARKTGIAGGDVKLSFLGFGTMNGRDGKPFKTRAGGVMRLETLIDETREAVYDRINRSGKESDPEKACRNAQIIALAALKYGDLSNQASKDYVFDIEKFIEFEGNTGPYILYTIVRIKSILKKYGAAPSGRIAYTGDKREKELFLSLAGFNAMMREALEGLAPHKICTYIYNLSNVFNTFYHDVRILNCGDEQKRDSYISLLVLVKDVLETCIDLLGFSAPESM